VPRHGNEAPREAIKEEEVIVKSSAGDENKTITHQSTMMVAYDMASAVHRGSR
jgi:hypothetical protein